MQVHEDRMREVVEDSYIASTELANEMVREYGVDYRTGHEIINSFVRASEEAGIPASEARAEMLDEAAEDAIGKPLGMTDERLRELLDPAYFVEVTDSTGGVAPKEMARMIADRREALQAAHDRHLSRIETLEQAQARMVGDLEAV
jgi:argininosuccinate lyase